MFKTFTSRFPTWLDGNTWGVWHILGTSREPYGSNHHPRGARQQRAQVSAVLLCFLGGFFCFVFGLFCFSKSISDTPRKPSFPTSQSQAGSERRPPAFLQLHYRHIFTGSKPGLRIQMCSYQFLEGEYVWISSKNLSGWCRG